MFKTKNVVLFSWSLLLLILLVLLLASSYYLRPLVFDYATSTAEGKLLNISENVIYEVLSDNNITYNEISHITKDSNNNIKCVQLDSKSVNLLKAEISGKINSAIEDKILIKVGIPAGTLLSNEFLTGVGPDIYFYNHFYEGCKVDIKSSFVDTGINQVVHQITLDISLTGNIIALGKRKNFSFSNSAVIAQTVIVGTVPSYIRDFTNS